MAPFADREYRVLTAHLGGIYDYRGVCKFVKAGCERGKKSVKKVEEKGKKKKKKSIKTEPKEGKKLARSTSAWPFL